MSHLVQLLTALGGVLSSLEDERALLGALDRLDEAGKGLRADLETRAPPPAPSLPADCSAGHTWRRAHGVSASTGKPVTRRVCAVCEAVEEDEYTPPVCRRGGNR